MQKKEPKKITNRQLCKVQRRITLLGCKKELKEQGRYYQVQEIEELIDALKKKETLELNSICSDRGKLKL